MKAPVEIIIVLILIVRVSVVFKLLIAAIRATPATAAATTGTASSSSPSSTTTAATATRGKVISSISHFIGGFRVILSKAIRLVPLAVTIARTTTSVKVALP